MRINAKTEAGLMIMMVLAKQPRGECCRMAEISYRTNLSSSYAEQICRILRTAGLIKSVRGPGGGYALGALSEDITIIDVAQQFQKENNAFKGLAPFEQINRRISSVLGTLTLSQCLSDS